MKTEHKEREDSWQTAKTADPCFFSRKFKKLGTFCDFLRMYDIGKDESRIFSGKTQIFIDHFLKKFEYKTWEGDFPQNEGGMDAIG